MDMFKIGDIVKCTTSNMIEHMLILDTQPDYWYIVLCLESGFTKTHKIWPNQTPRVYMKVA